MLNLKHYQATKNASTLCEIITFHLKICRDYAITQHNRNRSRFVLLSAKVFKSYNNSRIYI